MTTRAIHLELAFDLTFSFINVLRRFLARRGPVKCIYSDNGSNFVGAEQVLKDSFLKSQDIDIPNFIRQQETTWNFKTPLRSYQAGVWERMIRTMRKILLAIMPNVTLTDDELQTRLPEVKSVVNSRPLTDVALEAGRSSHPITPNHLIHFNPDTAPQPTEAKKTNYTQRFHIVRFAADKIWKKWTAVYVKTI